MKFKGKPQKKTLMSRDPILKNERNKAITQAYQKLERETVKGLSGKIEQKYRHSAILSLLSSKFYLSPETIEGIIQKH